ncbi:MAG: flagellar hook-length control protein FliK [Oscillospiraceae bacterium]|nr:flagellar hook-length control protein FliK [Oscillospiraceae bacterium]
MAVSMNSGFMRSDYMISDAALPIRMEELDIEQLEQEAKFSDILGEIGEATVTEAPAANQEKPALTDGKPEALGMIEEDAEAEVPVLGKAELKALAKAVAQGKIKLDEIPEEYVTDVLLMVIAMLMLGVPEDEIPEPEEASKDAAEPVQVDIRTAETFLSKVEENTNISELLQIVSETAGVEIPEDMKQALGRQIEIVTLAQEISSEKTVAPVVSNVMVTDEVQTADVHVALDNVDAQPMAQPDVQIRTQESVQPETTELIFEDHQTAQTADATKVANATKTVNSDQTEQVKLTEEFEQLRKVISEYNVRRTETEQPVQQSYTAQAMSTDNAAKNRVVSKSEELEMLKSGTKPTELDLNIAIEGNEQKSESGMQAEADLNNGGQQLPMEQQMSQNIAPEAPVVFVRSDGTEVEVRPAEIIRQITTTVVEQSTTAEGDTEYSITLTPEDLGNITVKLTKTVDGLMTVSITADNAKTQRLIEQHGAALQENLRNNGIELENWQTVNQSQQQARAQDYSGSSRNPYYSGDNDSNDDDDAEGTSFAELITAM